MSATAALLLVLCGAAPAAAGQDRAAPRVPDRARAAVTAYLQAPAEAEEEALRRAVAALRGDVRLGAASLRALPPLSPLKPGTHHGRTFQSGERSWEYSIHLPQGYDGAARLPVLVLPDHGSVDPESGLAFWKGKPDAERYVLFRPVIVRHRQDRERFPDGQFFALDREIALVMRDALAHLRLHYAVDPERLSMTGLSQAGYYTWYYAVSFPDQWAAIVPESSGGMAVRAAVLPLAGNLSHVAVRILHTDGDQVTPYADAVAMRDALAEAGAPVEMITYTADDYGGAPFPRLHPGPGNLRLRNVLPWAHAHRRSIPSSFTRVLRYRQQGWEGRFLVPPPDDPSAPLTVTCQEEDGVLRADAPGVTYLVSPEDVAAGKAFKVGDETVRPAADLALMLRTFKESGDRGRLAAAAVRVTP